MSQDDWRPPLKGRMSRFAKMMRAKYLEMEIEQQTQVGIEHFFRLVPRWVNSADNMLIRRSSGV